MAASSCGVRSATEQRSRPTRPFASSVKAVSDWMPEGFRDFGLITIVLVSMGYLLGRGLRSLRLGSEVLREQSVEGGNGLVDVLARDEVGRKKAQYGFVRAVEEDVMRVHHGLLNGLGDVGGVEVEADHEAEAACLFNG